MIRCHFTFEILFTAVVLLIADCARSQPAAIDPEKIDIARDSFGVPHIFAKTDPEVAYGLAWATAEDDVDNAQFMLAAMEGRLGLHNGMSGVKIDFAVQFLGVMPYVETHYDKEIPADVKRLLEGYAAGANAYFNSHPDKVWDKRLMPVRPQHLVAGYMLGMALMGGVEGTVTRMVDGQIVKDVPKPEDGIGSNAFAFNSRKTEHGNTLLAINAHQPIEGLLSWYEAHVCSEEGWNVLGALFHGSSTIFLGTNENLGWGHTTGQLDEIDVFKLSIHPRKKNWYRFDGEWKKLETKKAKLIVPLGKKRKARIHVSKKFWQSVYGPTMKNDHGVFAIRMPALINLSPVVQWYRMNKARNFTEFRDALNVQGLSRQNITYADRNDTIFFISNGIVPYRDRHYNWLKVVPGDTSATLWKEYMPIDSLAWFLNPDCGFVFNTNNSGFEATCVNQNGTLQQYNPNIGYRNEQNNRSMRFYELMDGKYADKRISYQDFKDIKFDHTFPKRLNFKGDFWLDPLFNMDSRKFPEIADAIKRIQAFDHEADTADRHMPIFLFTVYEMLKEDGKRLKKTFEHTDSAHVVLARCIDNAQTHMIKHFGSIDVPLSRVQVLKRGNVEKAVAGGPDMIRAVFGGVMDDGRIKMYVGDGYVQLVKFTKDGPQIESINAYGSSSFADSPHYTDQMEMSVKHRLKPMSLKKEEVLKSALRVYHPK